jgi:hypothetical protein
MNETIKIWFEELYKKEIKEIKGTISNEHLWELGYDGNEPVNPHTENIVVLQEYLEMLEKKLDEIKKIKGGNEYGRCK